MKKTTKKTKAPEILMNCVTNTTVNDIYSEYTAAKVRAGKTITEEQLDAYAINAVNKTLDIAIPAFAAATCFMCSECCTVKKQPWYKRMWNKIKGIFTR